jgi:hypothetical protein
MTLRWVLGWLGLSAGLLALVGCSVFNTTYRYRMTVEVETPQGVRTGSSVIQVTTSDGRNPGGLFPYGEVGTQVRGEAVATDLPGGRTLFALLQSEDRGVDAASYYALAALPPDPPITGTDAYPRMIAQLVKRRDLGTMPRKAYPVLVTFTDIRNPKTVARVDPDNLAASFGPGVTLRRITVQITDDPVTTGIENRLGWLDHLDKYRTDPKNPFTNTLPPEIGSLRSN